MRTRTRNLKRLLSLALCLCMVTGLLPAAALAANAPTITTDTLEAATVDVYYETTLTATASDQNSQLAWSSEDLPDWMTLTGNLDGTATLDGMPAEAGEVTFTVKVTETIPAESEEPGQETDPAEEADSAEPAVLADTKTYILTVAEAVRDEPESGAVNGSAPPGRHEQSAA